MIRALIKRSAEPPYLIRSAGAKLAIYRANYPAAAPQQRKQPSPVH